MSRNCSSLLVGGEEGGCISPLENKRPVPFIASLPTRERVPAGRPLPGSVRLPDAGPPPLMKCGMMVEGKTALIDLVIILDQVPKDATVGSFSSARERATPVGRFSWPLGRGARREAESGRPGRRVFR